MKSNLTDITLVVDRSGSMQQRRGDAEGGVNAFIQQQAEEPGEAFLTLVQFDTEYEIIHRGVPIDAVPEYRLEPRGMTALLDAVGRAINETGIRLKKMKKADRPGLVIFVITTDGLENSSTEFKRTQIKEMIEHQQTKYGWHFTFLGANQDAFAEAGAMGMKRGAVADFAMHKVGAAYEMTSKKVSRMRSQQRKGEEVKDEFTDEERKKMM
ncbi:MAG: VWA domain-containing protein [Gemmatimonadetes bacterium]|nr:VWA domain-containing protein [Gemmatimonadota bacterium]